MANRRKQDSWRKGWLNSVEEGRGNIKNIREYVIIHGKIVKDTALLPRPRPCSSATGREPSSLKQLTLQDFITKSKKKHSRRATAPVKQKPWMNGLLASHFTRGVRKKASSAGNLDTRSHSGLNPGSEDTEHGSHSRLRPGYEDKENVSHSRLKPCYGDKENEAHSRCYEDKENGSHSRLKPCYRNDTSRCYEGSDHSISKKVSKNRQEQKHGSCEDKKIIQLEKSDRLEGQGNAHEAFDRTRLPLQIMNHQTPCYGAARLEGDGKLDAPSTRPDYADSNVGPCPDYADSNVGPCPDYADSNVGPCPDYADSNVGPCPDYADTNEGPCPDSADTNVGPCPDSADTNVGPCPDYADTNELLAELSYWEKIKV